MAKFSFNYKDPTELEGSNTQLEEGEASFVVKKNYDTDKDGTPLTTKGGDAKIKVGLEITDASGNIGTLYEDMTINTAWKIYNLCKAVGKKELYAADGTDFDLLKGAKGRCIVKIQSSPGYNDRTIIDGYIDPYKDEPKATEAEVVVEVPNDPLPF